MISLPQFKVWDHPNYYIIGDVVPSIKGNHTYSLFFQGRWINIENNIIKSITTIPVYGKSFNTSGVKVDMAGTPI